MTVFTHQFDYDRVRIVTTERNYKKRLMKEMISFLRNKNSVNKRNDVEILSVIYHNVVTYEILFQHTHLILAPNSKLISAPKKIFNLFYINSNCLF